MRNAWRDRFAVVSSGKRAGSRRRKEFNYVSENIQAGVQCPEADLLKRRATVQAADVGYHGSVARVAGALDSALGSNFWPHPTFFPANNQLLQHTKSQ